MSEKQYIERYWRDAKPEDAIKEPPMVARFRDEDAEDWEYDLLVGWDRTDQCHWRSELDAFEHCQVYDAPDPGKGWRLIDTENEQPQDGDEIYDASVGLWTRRIAPFTSNVLSINRRRITPAVTYVPFTWEDREQLRGRWIKKSDNVEIQVTAFHCNSEGVFYSEGRSAKVLVERWRFVDTGKPVGKEVVQ